MSTGSLEHMKKIAILGSTGSIGTQALEVVREQPEHFQVELLSCGSNVDLLIRQALEFKPNAVVISDVAKLDAVKDALFPAGIKAYAGKEALEQCVRMEGIDLVLTALVGYAGLRPTLAAIDAGKHIALANKETLVVAGELVTKAATPPPPPRRKTKPSKGAVERRLKAKAGRSQVKRMRGRPAGDD